MYKRCVAFSLDFLELQHEFQNRKLNLWNFAEISPNFPFKSQMLSENVMLDESVGLSEANNVGVYPKCIVIMMCRCVKTEGIKHVFCAIQTGYIVSTLSRVHGVYRPIVCRVEKKSKIMSKIQKFDTHVMNRSLNSAQVSVVCNKCTNARMCGPIQGITLLKVFSICHFYTFS
jgi:hypothetical protein